MTRRPGPRPRRAARAALLLAFLLPPALVACGRRGPPVAPERRLPAAVQDLTAAVMGEGVRLSWTLPRIRVDRSPLKELARAEVYRRAEAPGTAEPPRPALLTFRGLFGPPAELAGFERVAAIPLKTPGTAEVRGDRVTYTDAEGLAFGRRYTYVVLAVDAQGRPSPPSNRVLVALAPPPEPPSRLVAQAGDGEVRLTWEPPSRLIDGSPVAEPLLYDVFRTAAPGPPPARPLNAEPLRTPAYLDLTVQNETTYYYAVRARLAAGPVSRPTEPVAATPEDRTPPAQPRGLVAVAAAGAVRLAWQAVGDPDLAGYHVYRSATPGRGYQRLTERPHSATTYVDAAVRPGETYYYVVTAVDRARRANESVPSPEASARVP